MDMYDILLAQNLGSGGGSGTTNYNALSNKPEINGVPLQGDKSFSDLGLGTAAEKDYTDTVTDGSTDLPTGDAVHDFVAAQVAYIDNSIDDVQEQIDTIREILGVELYGFKIDKQDSNPATCVTYMYDAAGKAPAHMDYTNGAFDYGDWENAWFVRENKPCALKYDGTVDYYLNPNDYTKKADGTASDVSDSSYAGNFMAAMPTVWVKRWEDSRYVYVTISNKQINSGYHAYAHDAGDGYINDFIYYPMFLGYIDSAKMHSIAGVTPSGMTTSAEEKASAEAVGTGWQMWDWSKHCLITDLLTLISRSTDSQSSFGYGVTNTRDDEDEQTHGMLATGSNDLGTGQFYGADDMLHHVKVFHIEDYWGNRYNRCLGLNRANGNYMCKAVRPYSTTPDSSYINIGEVPTATGVFWIKGISVNQYGAFPVSGGASPSTYFCDVLNTGNPTTDSIAMIGGMNGDLDYSGSYGLHISRAHNNALWFVGSSLCYNATHST